MTDDCTQEIAAKRATRNGIIGGTPLASTIAFAGIVLSVVLSACIPTP